MEWEWKVARKKMDRALQSRDDEKIVQVCIEHMMILTGKKAQLPPDYRDWLDKAWRSVLLLQGQISWWDQTKPQSPPARALTSTNDINAPEAAAAQQIIQAGPASKAAFLQMEVALVRGDIGRIVEVATAYEEVFRLFPEKVPDKWRVQVKAAWNFVVAWREADYKTTWLVSTDSYKQARK